MLRIHLLGEPVVEGDDGPIELAGSWRASSLLFWLAIHPGMHGRGTIAPLFWPDVLDSSARASLRNSLWAIRKAIGSDADALVATRERVGLEESAVWVDALAFEEHLREDRLTEALDLVRGEPLTGLEDDWAYAYRDEHRNRISDVYEQLAVDAADASDLAEATNWSRKRVALDPLDEAAQRALISRLIAAGDRSGALSAYGRFRQQLRTELGISPAAETRDLVLELRAEDRAAGGPEASAPTPTETPQSGGWSPGEEFGLPPRLRAGSSTPLVGREAELERLTATWHEVRDGGGARLTRLTGEAGIGKSRLAKELAWRAVRDGAVVLFGAADEDRLIPHQIWTESLAHLHAEAGTHDLTQRLGGQAHYIEPLLPLSAPRGDETEAVGESAENRVGRMREAVSALFASIASDVPLLMVVDDLHLADESSVAVLRRVLESRPQARIMFLATQRSEAEPGEALAGALSRLSREGLAEEIPLGGLEEDDVAALSGTLSEHELSKAVVGAIARESAGNPFFIGELVRLLDESEEDPGVLVLTRATVPSRVREVIDLRLARLSEPALRLLSVAAVIGTEFDLGLLEEVAASHGDEALALLEEGLAARLIAEREYVDRDAFGFAHVLVRRTLIDRLPRASKRRIHARVAAALESSVGDLALLEIAFHMCEARVAADRDRALDIATRAAERAISSLAYAEAVDLFTRARSLLPDGDPRRRTLALKRAVAYQALFHAVYDAAAGDTRAEPA